MVGEGLAPPVLPEFRLRRRFARPAPGEQAPRSSGGECEPGSTCLRRAEPDLMKGWRLQRTKHPLGVLRSLARFDRKDAVIESHTFLPNIVILCLFCLYNERYKTYLLPK